MIALVTAMTTWTPNRFLVGNGGWCSTCFPNGPPVGMKLGATWRKLVREGCNECAGAGRIAFSAEAIVEAAKPGKVSREASS